MALCDVINIHITTRIQLMYRYFLDFLENRSPRIRSVPLIVRGARQIGKSHSIREYGKTSFSSLAEINLELNPSLGTCFTSLNAATICRELEALLKIKIEDGKTLLFIDEIQSSPAALLSLRAFKEQRPGLDVIAAGSLLELILDDETLRSFPVGRVGFAWLYPMSFREFALALDEQQLIEILDKATLENPIPTSIHDKLLELVKVYYVVGGLPEVVDTFRETRSYLDAKVVQSRLILGYIADFAKYGKRYDYRKLQTVLTSIPRLVGKQIKYNQIDSQARARDLKQPLYDLEKSGLIRLVRATSANGTPLGSEEREGKFKAMFIDIGLMLNSLGLDLGSQPLEQALFANEGSLAEQFVGQELQANEPAGTSPGLYYWHREAQGSNAEVDFVVARNGQIIPIEVKAGTTGTLRSLRLFMQEKGTPIGIRICQHPLSFHDNILTVPLYMCSQINRLLDQARIP
jgi:predicted AAA+ superfamily ATPase